MLSQEQLAEIQKALEAATPGPWFQLTVDDDTCMQMEVVTTDKGALAGYLDNDFDSNKIVAATLVQSPEYVGDINWIENAHIIANAPTWIQQLLETVRAKDAEIERLIVSNNLKIETAQLLREGMFSQESSLKIAVHALKVISLNTKDAAIALEAREALERIYDSKEDSANG